MCWGEIIIRQLNTAGIRCQLERSIGQKHNHCVTNMLRFNLSVIIILKFIVILNQAICRYVFL
jgi:hypothetical protein